MDPEYTVIMVRGNEVEYYGKNHQEVIESMGMIQEKIEEQINDGWETSGGIQSIIIPHNKFTYDYIFNNFCSKSENSGCCTGCCYDEKYNINNTYRSRGDCCEDICPECCSTF